MPKHVKFRWYKWKNLSIHNYSRRFIHLTEFPQLSHFISVFPFIGYHNSVIVVTAEADDRAFTYLVKYLHSIQDKRIETDRNVQ